MALLPAVAPRTVLLAVLFGFAAALGAATPAGAVLATAPCSGGELRCATLSVPLDRSGIVPGTVDLNVRRLPARPVGTPTTEAVIALAGGPGQSAAPLTADFADALSPLLADRDLIVFDQRGTGQSGPLSCPGADSGPVATCARFLGPARGLYRSIDSAEDIEALRQVGGYDKLVIYGVSYGTRVALSYASLYPQHVSGLVLDSVVPVEGQDAFSRPSYAALGRVLAQLCADARCRHVTASPNADLRALLGRLAKHRISGRITDPDGKRAKVTLTRAGLWQILLAGDLNPSMRADLPGAMRAALRGDPTAALRLRARADGLTGTAATQDDGVNEVLFATTRCEETAFPWDRGAGTAARKRQADAAAAAFPAGTFAPFDASFALSSSIMPLCVGWPTASPAAAPLPSPPGVPTLVLAGADDLRTPIEQARVAVAAIPGAQIVTIPATGHSAIGSDLGHCAADAVKAFAAGSPAAACGPPDTTFSPSPIPPRTLRRVRGDTRRTRTLNAVLATIKDVKRQIVGDAIASGSGVTNGSRTGGLRSGLAIYANGMITLRNVVYVPGVEVSGFVALNATAGKTQLLIRGSAASRGTVSISSSGRASGRLGGHSFDTPIVAAGHPRGGLATPDFANPALRLP